MKLLIVTLGLFLMTAPAHAVHGGSDGFLWQIVKESDFCLVYIAGDEQGMERCTGTKADKLDEARDYEGGEGEAGDSDDDSSDN